jgi:ABC-type nitrate/sulfonate/bicarbonate transport system permease component
MMQNKGKIYVKKFIILLFWLGVWQILAMCVDNFLLVVTPLQALRALLTLAGQVEFWRSAFDSLWRIAFGFLRIRGIQALRADSGDHSQLPRQGTDFFLGGHP